MLYNTLSRLTPTRDDDSPRDPRRIILIRPCCIGDVVMATGALSALRELYPEAHITWAVGSWSSRAVKHHPSLNAILDTGSDDMPVRSISGLWQFVHDLRAGQFDLAVSLVRSPLMSLAVLMSGIPYRAGLDSLGRGFGYNIRLPINPTDTQHEAQIYLNLISQLAGYPVHHYANLPVLESARKTIQQRLTTTVIGHRYIVAHPGGGSNPGMVMDSKRYPPHQLGEVLNQVATQLDCDVVLIGGPDDGDLVKMVQQNLKVTSVAWVGDLSFAEIGAMAESALCYIGNDTGLTHLAGASGARVIMMMGPTDPQRYAPFVEHHLALWKPITLQSGGVAQADSASWDWAHDGFTVDEAVTNILGFLR